MPSKIILKLIYEFMNKSTTEQIETTIGTENASKL